MSRGLFRGALTPALHATALIAGGLVLYAAGSHARLGLSDTLLVALTAWSMLSTLFATNRWLGLRGLAITAAGLAVHLAARRAAQSGAGNLLRALLVVGPSQPFALLNPGAAWPNMR